MDILEKAIVFATEKHAGMVRKGTANPYILHPLEAAAIVGTMTTDREVIAAAVLHDVVEDTPTSISEIEERFGERIARLVAAESENKREDRPAAETWRIRKEETLTHLRNETDLAVKMITLGDKLSNIRSIYRDHLTLGDAIWNRFNQKDPAQHAWYYVGIAEAISELSAYPAWQEYASLLRELFPCQAEVLNRI